MRAQPDTSPMSAENTEVTAVRATFDVPPSFLEKPEPAPREEPQPLERSNLQLYLQEIGKTPLLTIEEEVALARDRKSTRLNSSHT